MFFLLKSCDCHWRCVGLTLLILICAVEVSANHPPLLFRQLSKWHLITLYLRKELANSQELPQELTWTINCETGSITYFCIN